MTNEQLIRGQQIQSELSKLKEILSDLTKANQLNVRGKLIVGPYTLDIEPESIKTIIDNEYKETAARTQLLEQEFVAL